MRGLSDVFAFLLGGFCFATANAGAQKYKFQFRPKYTIHSIDNKSWYNLFLQNLYVLPCVCQCARQCHSGIFIVRSENMPSKP